MTAKTDIEIAEAYIALQHAPKESQERDDQFWAFEEMLNVGAVDPDRTLRIILLILSKDDSAEVVEILAAGPMEDLLDGYGEQMIGKVEAEARSNPKFANLLGGVWPSTIAENVWRKVEGIRDRRGWDGIPK
jgi:hypothetical protein